MTGFIVEFSLVMLGFGFVWRRQTRARRRSREQAAQLDFDFASETHRGP